MSFARRLESLRQHHRGRLPFLNDAPPHDVNDLLARIHALENEAFEAAVQFVGSLKHKPAVPPLLALMCNGKASSGELIAHAIATIGGRQACPGFEQILREPHPPHVRYAAVYGLTWLLDQPAFETLLSVFNDAAETAAVRQAAEGFTYLVSDDMRRTPRWRTAVKALLHGLDDPDTDVRFRSVFGLGVLARSALVKLRELAARDTAISPLMQWTIQEEAQEAIRAIEAEGQSYLRSNAAS